MPPLDEPCGTPATRVRGARTRWLRLCDHTLTDIETQPLNSGGVALLAIRLQPLLHSGSGTKDHAMRHAHQTLSNTRLTSNATTQLSRHLICITLIDGQLVCNLLIRQVESHEIHLRFAHF